MVWDTTIRAPTLASLVARHLEEEIVGRGWPVGEVLGSESELLERFGVSRAVFREAVRVVENTGAARMRRGPGGGLVVTEPNRSGVVIAMSVWFSCVGVTIAEMLEARLVVLEGACQLAATRPEGRARAAEALEGLHELAQSGQLDTEKLMGVEGTIAGLPGNPALTLFVEAVADLGLSRLRAGRARIKPSVTQDELVARLQSYRSVIADVQSGDGNLAANRIRLLVQLAGDRMTDSGAGFSGKDKPGGGSGSDKVSSGNMAETVTYRLRDHIEESGWPVGKVLGSETELIERLGVSRAILREAVRILEHHGAVNTKRGPRGGIRVCAPDSASIVRSVRMFLEYEGVTPSNLSETRSVVEVAAARLAAERQTPELASSLVTALQREGASGDAAISFGGLHHAIAEGTGNRLLALFVDVMGELVPPHLKPERRTPAGQAELSTEVHRAHERLVRAIVDGDPEQAAGRMKRHMIASAEVFT